MPAAMWSGAEEHGDRREDSAEGRDQGIDREFPGRAILDGSGDVRREAARALGGVGEFGVIGPAIRALDSKSVDVRASEAVALRARGYGAAVQALVAHFACCAQASAEATPGGHAPTCPSD